MANDTHTDKTDGDDDVPFTVEWAQPSCRWVIGGGYDDDDGETLHVTTWADDGRRRTWDIHLRVKVADDGTLRVRSRVEEV